MKHSYLIARVTGYWASPSLSRRETTMGFFQSFMPPRTARGRSSQRSTPPIVPVNPAFSPPAEKSIRTRKPHPFDVFLASSVCPLALYLSGSEHWTWALALGVQHVFSVYVLHKYPTLGVGVVSLGVVMAVFSSLLSAQEALLGLLLCGSFEVARRGLHAIGGVWCHENMGEVVVTLEAVVLCGVGWLWEGAHRWYRGGGVGLGGGEEGLLQAAWVVLGGTSAIALSVLFGLALGLGGTSRASTPLVWASIAGALVCEYQWVNAWVLGGRVNCVVWLLGWVTGATNPLIGYTVAWWLVVLGGSLPFIPLAGSLVGGSRLLPPLTHSQANLILRKVYHVVGVLILLPPLLLLHHHSISTTTTTTTTTTATAVAQYHGFLALAVACAVKVLGVLELIRALKPHPSPLPRLLHALFTRHTDDREMSSPFFLTHVYLLVGMVAPFLLRGAGGVVGEGFVVSASGVLALGVGDAAAAVGGTLAAATWGKAACVPWGGVGRMVRSGVIGEGGEGGDVRMPRGGKNGKGTSSAAAAAAAAARAAAKRGSGKTLCGTLSYIVFAGGVGALCMGALGMNGWKGRVALFTSVLGGAFVEAVTGSVDNALVPTFAWAFSRAIYCT